MTALVDGPFRVFAAASQGDTARVRALLADLTDDQVEDLLAVLERLRSPVTRECSSRVAARVSASGERHYTVGTSGHRAVIGQPGSASVRLRGLLTPWQVRILQTVADGQSREEAAADLGIAAATVKTHRVLIYRALGVGNAGHAVAVGFRTGLRS